MSKNYLLYVSGEDYAASSFANGHDKKRMIHLYHLCDRKGGSMKYCGYRLSIREFGPIDPDFIKFIRRNIQDYDDSKHQNFFMFTEEEIKGSTANNWENFSQYWLNKNVENNTSIYHHKNGDKVGSEKISKLLDDLIELDLDYKFGNGDSVLIWAVKNNCPLVVNLILKYLENKTKNKNNNYYDDSDSDDGDDRLSSSLFVDKNGYGVLYYLFPKILNPDDTINSEIKQLVVKIICIYHKITSENLLDCNVAPEESTLFYYLVKNKHFSLALVMLDLIANRDKIFDYRERNFVCIYEGGPDGYTPFYWAVFYENYSLIDKLCSYDEVIINESHTPEDEEFLSVVKSWNRPGIYEYILKLSKPIE